MCVSNVSSKHVKAAGQYDGKSKRGAVYSNGTKEYPVSVYLFSLHDYFVSGTAYGDRVTECMDKGSSYRFCSYYTDMDPVLSGTYEKKITATGLYGHQHCAHDICCYITVIIFINHTQITKYCDILYIMEERIT